MNDKERMFFYFVAFFVSFWMIWYPFTGWFRSIAGENAGIFRYIFNVNTGIIRIDLESVKPILLPLFRIAFFWAITAYSIIVFCFWYKTYKISNNIDIFNSSSPSSSIKHFIKDNQLQLLVISISSIFAALLMFPLWTEQIRLGGDEVHFVSVITMQVNFITFNSQIPFWILQVVIIALILVTIAFCIRVFINPTFVDEKIAILFKALILKNILKLIIIFYICGTILLITAEIISFPLWAGNVLRYGPFSYLPIFLSMVSLGLSELGARIPSLMFYFLILILLYCYLESHVGKNIGLLGSILFAWSPIALFFLPQVLIDFGAIFFILLILYSLDLYVQRKQQIYFLFIWLIFCIGSLYKSILLVMFPIICICLFLSIYSDSKTKEIRNKGFLLVILAAVTSVVSILSYYILSIFLVWRTYVFSPQNLQFVLTYLFEMNTYFVPFITAPLVLLCSLIVILLILRKDTHWLFMLTNLLVYWAYYFFFTFDDAAWFPEDRFGIVLVIPFLSMVLLELRKVFAFISNLQIPNINLKKFRVEDATLALLAVSMVFFGTFVTEVNVEKRPEANYVFAFREAFSYWSTISNSSDCLMAKMGSSPIPYYAYLYGFKGTVLTYVKWHYTTETNLKNLNETINEFFYLNVTYVLLPDLLDIDGWPSGIVQMIQNNNSFILQKNFTYHHNSLYLWRFHPI